MNKILYNGQVIIDLDELTDKYTKSEVDALVSSVFKYKGTVATKADLNNIVDMKIGDCYNVEADGVNYAWNGEEWSALSGTVDLTNYYTKEQVDGKFNSYLSKNNNIEYTPTEDYHPATKKYVDENSSSIDTSTLQDNLRVYPIYYDVPGSNPFWVSKGSALEVLFIDKVNEIYAEGIDNFIISIIDLSDTKARYNSHIKVSTIGNNKTLTITSLSNFLRDSNGLITCRYFGNYSYSGGYKLNTSTNKFEHSASSGNAFALFKYEDDGGAYTKPSDVLTKTNSTSYTPSANYHPATKKYVDDLVNSRDVLEGTYNDTDVTAGYDFSVGSVNALIDTLNKTPQMIQVNLTREFEDRTDINSVMADIGFNSSVSTDGTTTDEVSLHYVIVSQGMYLRFYGSATLTDGHITSPLHCFSEDYNG